ncbi:uncharacterized protein TRAVEDRAFT_50926 [Trametes versicolor FP-101664 SS1]|uniref:uncharacterized protein n=1 Tax=Trametes versicolor (strain FP-101664) TaxID=717944 RepID=UPI0004624603|nr:uncharacterized protein TRAVEDRAFT_50926 [Trametes versicolor FP-101664 SS1]EIW54790.1 hypothetical protein TRAVEDRAFT_50926 [Trametes versicolor FP-101664 SS1]
MSHSIAFAPNITPGTYNDPPSPAEPCAESLLFPASDDCSAASRRAAAAHAKKKPENHIPRPPNAFILFRSSFIKQQHVSSEVETNHSTLSKIIGLTWQNLPHEERQVWHAKAKAALEEHKRKFPQYAFRPMHTKGKAPAEKRKVREVEPKDIKRCTKIAQLLVEGKKGRELDQAIQEFDRVHVPEIVTRFEAPITARHYRRSSSAPAPDTERSNPSFLSPEPSTPSKRQAKRSSSSQPEAPRELSQECATPSPLPSEADTESDWYSSPSSPYCPTTPSYSLPPTNPSFDEFNTFSFDNTATPAMPPYQACDPLDQQGYQVYQQDSQESCVPGYAPALQIDTSFMDSWTTPSSPLSSMPGTPPTYSVMHGLSDPMSVMENYHLPQLQEGYDQSPEFLPQQQQLYTPAGLPAYCAPAGVEMLFGAEGFAAPAKHDFASYYGRPAVDPVDAAAFPPAYMASVPTYAM